MTRRTIVPPMDLQDLENLARSLYGQPPSPRPTAHTMGRAVRMLRANRPSPRTFRWPKVATLANAQDAAAQDARWAASPACGWRSIESAKGSHHMLLGRGGWCRCPSCKAAGFTRTRP